MIHTDIDRIKVTFSSKILVDSFKNHPHVCKEKPQDIGYYHCYEYTDSNNNKHHYWEWKFSWQLNTPNETIETDKRKINKNIIRIKPIDGKVYQFIGGKLLTHYSYRINNFKHLRVIKTKTFVTIEINDILQNKPNKKPFFIIREVLETLIKLGIVNYRSRKRTPNNIRQKAYRILQNVSVSEIELASNLPHMGKLLFDSLNHDKIVQEKNTKYWNNSFNKSRRYFWKFYDRSARLVEREYQLSDDVFRFEITFGKNLINKIGDRNLLKLSRKQLIQLLIPLTSAAIKKLCSCLPNKVIQTMIKEYDSSVSINSRQFAINLQKILYSKF